MKLSNYWLGRKNLKSIVYDECRITLPNSHVFTCFVGTFGGVNIVRCYPLLDEREQLVQKLEFEKVREIAEKLFAIKKEISAELFVSQAQ